MVSDLPVVAIEPSPRNDLTIWLSKLVSDQELLDATIEPERIYRRYRAEIRLLIDLILAIPLRPPHGDPNPTRSAEQLVHDQELEWSELQRGSLLR